MLEIRRLADGAKLYSNERAGETSPLHWIKRRLDGVYLLWGNHAENCAFLPGWSMEMPIGTRIEG